VGSNFLIPIQITNNTVINCKELKNRDYFSILKYLQNQDYKNLSLFFENLINESLQEKTVFKKLNLIDKAIILLTLRSICISPEITLESKKLQKIIKKINISNIIKKLQELKFERSISINEKIIINLSLPKKLSYNSLDEVIENCIYSITNDSNDKILDPDEISETLSLLPGSYFFEINKFVQEAEDTLSKITLIEADDAFNLKSINCSLLSNNIFSFMLSVFSDSLINFYNLIYIFGTKLNLSKSDFEDLTPAESTLLTNMYIREQEELAKASKQPTQSIGQKVDK
jgi:hypothetical protein